MIEGNRGEIEDIKDKVIEFYDHPISSPDWPKLEPINEALVAQQITKYQGLASSYPDIVGYGDTLRKWEFKKGVITAIGPYNEISDKAMITIQLDNATSFKTYVSVLNEIMAGINELRSELCLTKFGIPYNKIEKSKVPDDQAKVKILRAVYPKRIMKAKSKNAQ